MISFLYLSHGILESFSRPSKSWNLIVGDGKSWNNFVLIVQNIFRLFLFCEQKFKEEKIK